MNTTPTNAPPDPDQLAGQYVLGTLSSEERRALELALPGDPDLRAAVQYWEERLLPLTTLAEPVAPPPALWARIERSTAPVATPAAAPARAGWWQGLTFWRSLAAGGMLAAAAMAVVIGLRVTAPTEPHLMVVLAAPQNMAPGWVIRATGARAIRLEPVAGTPTAAVPPQRALQLWTKADGWSGPVSLGLVKPGQALELRLEQLPPLQPNQLFEITLEPEQGSPIGRPTGPILFIGRAVEV